MPSFGDRHPYLASLLAYGAYFGAMSALFATLGLFFYRFGDGLVGTLDLASPNASAAAVGIVYGLALCALLPTYHKRRARLPGGYAARSRWWAAEAAGFGLSFNAALHAAQAFGALFGGWAVTAPESPIAYANSLAFLLTAGLLVPVVEELAFRGLIYLPLRWRCGPAAATAFSSALFALSHLPAFGQVACGLILGAACARAYEKHGTIAAPMALHISFNASNAFYETALPAGPAGSPAAFCAFSALSCALFAIFSYSLSQGRGSHTKQGETENAVIQRQKNHL